MADELLGANNSLAPAQDVDAPSAADEGAADAPTADSQNEQTAGVFQAADVASPECAQLTQLAFYF
ncbi:SWI/SNF and RSC complex subunit Ssr2 [Diplodia seriata]